LKQFNSTKSALLIAGFTTLLNFFGFCQLPDSLVVTDPDSLYATFSEPEKRFSRNAVLGLKVADGLQATLFASEPDVINPINIDVDHRGRVWACEAYNYRPAVNGKSELGQGDRIVIMEDKNGDGKSDVTKVFYQGPELNSPLGIWVMGNKAVRMYGFLPIQMVMIRLIKRKFYSKESAARRMTPVFMHSFSGRTGNFISISAMQEGS
jgi:hypothetical protein